MRIYKKPKIWDETVVVNLEQELFKSKINFKF